ncbi:unnamed protein product, partial [Laminaria digitata]
QDRWGRQRGGRKARWDKLDRQPSTLKGRLRSANSSGHADVHLDSEEAFSFAFIDGLGGVGIFPGTPDGGGGGGGGSGSGLSGSDADGSCVEIVSGFESIRLSPARDGGGNTGRNTGGNSSGNGNGSDNGGGNGGDGGNYDGNAGGGGEGGGGFVEDVQTPSPTRRRESA